MGLLTEQQFPALYGARLLGHQPALQALCWDALAPHPPAAHPASPEMLC